MELILTGTINKIVPIEQDVVDEAVKTATRIATFSGPAVSLAKQAVKSGEQHAGGLYRLLAKNA
jgi:enoyl-CoA hydratase